MNDPKIVWIVGQVHPSNGLEEQDMQVAWEFQGVFDTETLAVAACKSPLYFIGPAVINEELPETITEWFGAYYPISTK